MNDEDKSKEQLLSEVTLLRQQISELKSQVSHPVRLEEVITESEIHFADLLDTANDAIISINEDQRIIIFNQGAKQIFGYAPAEILGKPLDLLIPEKFHKVHQTHIAAFAISPVISRKMGERQEILGRRKNGEEFPAEAAISKLEVAGQKIFTVVLRDITERKLLQEILIKSEERHRAAAELASDYAYAYRVEADQSFMLEWVTESFSYVTGFTLAEAEDRGGWRNLIHPDDAVIVQQRLSTLFSGQKCVDEFRIITASGQIRWLRDHARPVWDEGQARVVRIYGAAQDVTERKQAEEALRLAHETLEQQVEERTAELRQANERLQSEIAERKQLEEALQQATWRYHQLFEHAPVMYIITRNEPDQSVIIDFNDSFLRTLEYSREEVLDQPFAKFCTSATQTRLISDGYQQVLRGQTTTEECDLVTRDGQIIETLVKTLPEVDARGQVTGTRAAFIDISERKKLALENARLYAETQRRAKELLALNNAGRAMASFLDLNIVLEQAISEIKAMLEVEGVSVLLLDSTGNHLTFVAAASPSAEKMIGVSVPLIKSIAGWVVQQREPVLLTQADQDSRFYRGIDTLTGLTTQSLLAVPLLFKDRVIGVIEAINDRQGFFNQHDLELLEALGSWAVIAIENARLHTEMKRRAQQLLTLHELDWIITASLHIDDVYHALARHTARLLHYDSIYIALLDASQIHLAFVAGESRDELTKDTILPRQTSVTDWVARWGQPLLRHNIPGNMRFAEDEQLVALGIQSGMVIPLRVKGEVFGTWNINSQQISAYTPDDLAIAGSMGDQLAIAIDNARLYQAERVQFQRLQQSQAQLIRIEKMAALGRLVASVAHEINNPIQAIQNALTLVEEELADYRRPEKINLYIGIAKNEFERIAAIVRRMRDFYRPTQPAQLIAPGADYLDKFYIIPAEQLQPINLHFILDNVLQLAYKQLQQSGIIVEHNWADNLPLLRGSSDHLKQVFLNLVLNALDSMSPSGGGTLHVHTTVTQAELLTGQPQTVIRLDFSDTGAGIPAEVLPRLFEPLFTTKEHGSGFGLFTSYKIIEAHHGQIVVESQVGKGTTFTVLLPLW